MKCKGKEEILEADVTQRDGLVRKTERFRVCVLSEPHLSAGATVNKMITTTTNKAHAVWADIR